MGLESLTLKAPIPAPIASGQSVGRKRKRAPFGEAVRLPAKTWLLTLFLLGWGAFAVEARMRVATTVGMLTDVVRVVAGDRVEVIGLIGEGVDPHLFKPTRSTLIQLQQADLILYNGLHLEGRMTEVFERLRESGTPTLAVAEAVLQTGAVLPLPGDRAPDPHVWMDVTAWRSAVEVIAAFLEAHDPEGARVYEAGAQRLQAELLALDAYGRSVLGTVPESQRVLVTAHDAFAYFGRAYGFEVRGIQGVSTESESGLKELEALIDLIVARGIPAVFAESSVSEKNVRALIEGAQARGHSLRFGGVLYADAMGPGGTYAGTYVGMLDHNFTTITTALGGTVPEGGMKAMVLENP